MARRVEEMPAGLRDSDVRSPVRSAFPHHRQGVHAERVVRMTAAPCLVVENIDNLVTRTCRVDEACKISGERTRIVDGTFQRGVVRTNRVTDRRFG